MTIEEQIAAKQKEITHYEGCLDRAFPSRWYNSGRRHLEELQEELRKLQEEASK